MRYLCVRIPDWSLSGKVLGVTDPIFAISQSKGRIVQLTPWARKAGLFAGQKVGSALALYPTLQVFPYDEVSQQKAFELVAQSVEGLCAYVQIYRPGVLLAPVAGPAKWAGGEVRLQQLVTQRLVEDLAQESSVGVATGLLAALVAGEQGVIVPDSRTESFLDALPIGILKQALWEKDADDFLQTLNTLGLDTVGKLRALPAAKVIARFGINGERALQLIRGEALPSAAVKQASPNIKVFRKLDPPAFTAAQCIFFLNDLAGELTQKLYDLGLGCTQLEIGAILTDGKELRRSWNLPGLFAATEVTRRARWQLEAWLGADPKSGATITDSIGEVFLEATRVGPAKSFGKTLWGKPNHSSKANQVAARAGSLLGAKQVLEVSLQGGFDPRSQIKLQPFGSPPSKLPDIRAPWEGALVGKAPELVFEHPLPARLLADLMAVKVTDRDGLSRTPKYVFCQGKHQQIVDYFGPWVVLGRWWQKPISNRSTRHYLRVETDTSQLLLVTTDWGQTWWVDAQWI